MAQQVRDNREVLQVSREQANSRVAGKLSRCPNEPALLHSCWLSTGVPLPAETESPHRPEHHTFIQDVSMVYRQSFDDTAAFCGAMKTNPAWAAES